VLLGLIGLAANQGALAQPPAPSPASAAAAPRWHVDGSGDRCLLERRLADGSTLILRTFPFSGAYELMLVRPDWPGSTARIADGADIVLFPEMNSYKSRGALVPLGGDAGKAVAFAGLPSGFVAALAGAKTLSIGAGGKPVAEVAIPAAAKGAVAALQQCEAVKAVDWGADAAAFEAGGVLPKPIGDTGKWLDQRDLGSVNTWHEFGAAASFRLVIGADGRIERCDVLEASLNSGLRANGCKSLIARARYEPARDPQGKAVRAALTYSTAYQVTVRFIVD
jgi:hypothetical protein